MAVTRVGSETIDNSSANRDPASFSHTTTSDTDLLLVCVLIEGNEAVDGTPTFDSSNLTLIRDTGDTTSNSDVRIYVWGIVTPGAKTATISVNFTSNVNPSAICCINYSGVNATSVATATNFISEDINTTATSTGVHASGGSANHALFVVGCGQGNDMQPAAVDNSFVEVWDEETGTNSASDFGHIGAELLTGAPSAVTITYGSPTTDQNTSVFIELLASGVLDGSLFEDTDAFFHSILRRPGDFFFGGEVANVAADADQDIEGSILTDADTLNDGAVSPQYLLSSLLTDADTLNHGKVDLILHGSILTDADNLFQGEIGVGAVDIEGSILTDADTLNDGRIAYAVRGPEFSDPDTFNDGEIGVGAVDIEGSILTDADTLNDGSIIPNIFGSLLTDADTLFDGLVRPFNLFGSILTDADTFFDGEVAVTAGQDIEQSKLDDVDTFFNGEISLLLIPSLLEDIDTFFNGTLILGPDPTPYRIINVATVVGLGDVVDLVDEVILTDSKGAITGSTEGEFKVETQDDTV